MEQEMNTVQIVQRYMLHTGGGRLAYMSLDFRQIWLILNSNWSQMSN